MKHTLKDTMTRKSLPILCLLLTFALLSGCVAPAPTTSSTAETTTASATPETSNTEPVTDTPTADTVTTDTATRVVTDALGNEIEIPIRPERIVVLDYNSVEELLALDIKPIGILFGNNADLADLLVDIPIVGEGGAPNLESVLTLQPDLIIAVGWWVDDTMYAQLQEIAPTVMIERQNFYHWKQYLLNMGELLGRTAEAEAALAEYDAHVTQVREAIGEEWLANNEVTVFLGNSAGIRIWVTSFINTIFDDVGIKIPQVQIDALPEGRDRLDDLSLEQIPMLDADVIFYLDSQAEQIVEFNQALGDNALWKQLPAVQAGHAFGVNAPLNEGSIISAHMVLDVLEEHLVAVKDAE